MLIQKTFHLHQSASKARNNLADIASYRRELSEVRELSVTAEGTGRLEFTPRHGQKIAADFVEASCEKLPGCHMFRSVKGNVEFVGMFEFFQVKENLTEVVVTIDYQLGSRAQRMMDWVTSSTERFLDRQIERIQIHFDGMHASSHAPASATAHAMNFTQAPRFA